MAKDNTTKVEGKKVYSENIEINNINGSNQLSEPNVEDLTKSIGKLNKDNQILRNALGNLQEESMMLRELFERTNKELNNLRRPALLVATISNIYTKDKVKQAIIKLTNGNQFYCNVAQGIDDLNPGDTVLVEQKSLNVIKKLESKNNLEVEKYIIIEKPKESWEKIGGLKEEIQEVKEVIELPLNKPELFKEVGIDPPKGVLLYGPPGTGKTLLAKAVANSTKATFIEVVGSELVQKFIGEGAKLIKEMFKLARQRAPTIIFIDEIDALAAMRMETGTSGEREVNRTFMQLLAELDGFNHLDNVKVIGATNRLDILDRAMIRPGRLDRLIEVNLPDKEGRLEIFKVHTSRMSLRRVKVKELIDEMEEFSGAEIRAVCTEAGYFAIRDSRNYVTHKDFMLAIDKIKTEEEEESDEHKILFG